MVKITLELPKCYACGKEPKTLIELGTMGFSNCMVCGNPVCRSCSKNSYEVEGDGIGVALATIADKTEKKKGINVRACCDCVGIIAAHVKKSPEYFAMIEARNRYTEYESNYTQLARGYDSSSIAYHNSIRENIIKDLDKLKPKKVEKEVGVEGV